MPLPPRSEWAQMTAVSYNAIAQYISDNELPLVPDDGIQEARALMGENPSVLDLGCGSGRITPALKELGVGRIVGVDFSEELIRIAKTRYPEHDFRVGNILNLKDVLGEEKFDAFWAITSLMHILPENMLQAAISIREVVRTGAIGFVTTPYGQEEDLFDTRSLDTKGGILPEGYCMFRNEWNPTALGTHFRLGGFQMVDSSILNRSVMNMTVRAI